MKFTILGCGSSMGVPRADGFFGKCNPKSSTGRLDIFCRTVLDFSDEYEKIPKNYNGEIFLEITSRSFNIKFKSGDKIKIDLNNSRIDLLISDKEIEKRKKNVKIPKLKNQTPWQEISRKMVGQLETGACLETESIYLDITKTKGMPRHSH